MASAEQGQPIVVPEDAETETVQEFAALGLGPQALHAITDLSYSAPTPIQRQAIPLLLAGRDVIA
ncbi:MAG: DEAD/DEAH box helicase, partial [Ktedonobacterales bacterium]